MSERKTFIRLGVTGEEAVKSALTAIGDTGGAAAKRYARDWEKATRDAELAIERQERSFKKIEAMKAGLDPSRPATPQPAFEEPKRARDGMMAQYEKRAQALTAALDPLYAAQLRFDTEMAKAKVLLDAGALGADRYAQKLGVEEAALEGVRRAHGGVNSQSAQTRAGMQQLGFQANDMATMFASGASAGQIFGTQLGQIVQAMQMMDNGGSKVLAFLSSFKGTLVSVAAIALIPFIAKLFEESEASKKAKEAAEKHRDAVLALADAQEKAIQTAERRQSITTAEIKLSLDAAIATRTRTRAELERQKAELEANLAQQRRFSREGGDGATGAAGAMGALAADTQTRLDALNRTLAKNAIETKNLQTGFEAGFARMVGLRVDAQSTPEGAINARYDRREADAMANPALRGTANAARLAAELKTLNDQRQRELDLVTERAKPTGGDGTAMTGQSIAKLFREGLGVRVTSVTGGKHVAGSDHYADRAIDFVPRGGMGSMSKDDIRRFVEERGQTIRRNAAGVEQLFGPGDKGHSDHFHVALQSNKLALDDFTDAAKRAADAKKVFDDIMDMARGTPDVVTDALAMREVDDQRRIAAERAFAGDSDPFAAANDNYERDSKARLDAVEQLLDRQKQSWQDLSRIGENAIDRLFDPSSAESWGDRIKGVLNDLMAEMTRLALINPLKNMLFGQKNETLGSLMSVFGAVLGKKAPVKANAAGTEYFSGGASLVGENGPEIVSMPRGSRVSTAAETRRMFAANDRGPALSIDASIHAPGADPAALARVEAAQRQIIADMPARVVAAYQDAVSRGAIR